MMGLTKASFSAVTILLAGIASAQVSDLHNDFDRDANPHLGWSYGSSKTVTEFEPYTNNTQVKQFYATRDQSELIGWSNPNSVFPYAARNQGTTILYQRWRPGDVVLHPSADLFSIVRWTNAARGSRTVHLFATFRRVENVTANESEWYVVANGKVIDSGTLGLGNEERSVSEVVTLASGGSISFVVGCKVHQEGTDLSVNAVIKPRTRQ